jgi:hypothetical protein
MDSETGKVQEMMTANDKKPNDTSKDKFEEFKQKYDDIDKFYKSNDVLFDKIISSAKMSTADKTTAEIFKVQNKMLGDLAKNDLYYGYRLDNIEGFVNDLFTTVRNLLVKLNDGVLNLNTEVSHMKTKLNNPMYERIDQFITIMAEKEKQNQAKIGEYVE